MNENIDLTKILKDCPEGTKLYSTIFGDVAFCYIDKSAKFPIILAAEGEWQCSVSANGRHYVDFNGECTLFPSKEQRDWSKFTAPWYKKDKFDPKTLKPFDKVLILDTYDVWQIEIFSHIRGTDADLWYQCLDNYYSICIPYNDDTKHLVGTTEEAPEYYRYWED